MAFLNPAVAEGIRVVVRQATDTLTSAAFTTDPTPLPTITTASPSSISTTGTSCAVVAPVPSDRAPNTNCRIIVGVKYCFRYNARSRQMRLNEDGEPINMDNMPRPHRRRREKKLMTMDEVNEKFPMLKYKNWVATRAQEGLPTRGGVSVPPSRANSVRDVEGVAPELPSKEDGSKEERPTTSTNAAVNEKQTPKHVPKESTSSTVNAAPRTSTDAQLVPTVSESATLSKDPNRTSQDDEDEDDEHINAALPPECMGTSGDTCAICIDTLEDDDDVRGLTCGHAFHAVCLDPWLTSRRACCPLCKADYYTPKPRPLAPEPGDSSSPGVITVTLPDNRNVRMNMPSRPRYAFFGLGRGGRPMPSGQATVSNYTAQPSPRSNRSDTSNGGFLGRLRRTTPASATSTTPIAQNRIPVQATQSSSGAGFSLFRSAFPAFRMGNRDQNQTPAASGANGTVTPSDLEAGVRH
ncbi:hypothetical protein OQA88_4206 [Cercophora sp. LCS_1]